MTPSAPASVPRPRVVIAGLGPAGADFVPVPTTTAIAAAAVCLVRTARHPALPAAVSGASGPVVYLDHRYEEADSFDDVYAAIVEDVVGAAAAVGADSFVCYLVPGSPLVAERTVELLRADERVAVTVVPALSFLDLAWERLGVDPVRAGVRIVDATAFGVEAAGERGPLLVAQCHSRAVLSAVKLAVDDAEQDGELVAVVLHHLGLADESITEVPWADIDRSVEADHLTTLWVPRLGAPVASEMVRLEELVRTLRDRCPWDRRQTHGSLGRHLLEEAYEALDAIEAVAASEPDVAPELVAHLEEELGDVLFQVYFHAVLGAEEGRFTLADVARGIHDKLVARHPHVFGDAVAETPQDVADRWEVLKKAEKGRASVTDGIPTALPALALTAKLLGKGESVDMVLADGPARLHRLDGDVAALRRASSDQSSAPDAAAVVGELLFDVVDLARALGVDAEGALRARAMRFGDEVRAAELNPRSAS